ncbi:MAG TPA: transcriptional activator RfaH [Opitutaceae bacterium]|jgi:transcriptional antiterminator RfaH
MNWYCVHTRPRKESQVALHLQQELGRPTYLPKLRAQRTIRRVKRMVTRPLFPRYLFCQMDLGSHFRAVRYTQDVLDIVRFGEKPAVVADAMIEELRSWAGEAVDIVTLVPPLAKGDTVEITGGPLRGLQAMILNSRNDRDRVTVLLSLLRQGAQISIDRSQLVRIGGLKAGSGGA